MTSKSRIKRLRDVEHPQYRLRVGDMRIFYDVDAGFVKVSGVVAIKERDERTSRSKVVRVRRSSPQGWPPAFVSLSGS